MRSKRFITISREPLGMGGFLCKSILRKQPYTHIQVRRLYCAYFNLHDINQAPTRPLIRCWVTKFESEGTLMMNNHIGWSSQLKC